MRQSIGIKIIIFKQFITKSLNINIIFNYYVVLRKTRKSNNVNLLRKSLLLLVFHLFFLSYDILSHESVALRLRTQDSRLKVSGYI